MLGLFCAAAEEGVVVGHSVGELIGARMPSNFFSRQALDDFGHIFLKG